MVTIQRNWQSLIKPEKLEVEPGSDPHRVATVMAEPLERGFGMTLGNAIRRIQFRRRRPRGCHRHRVEYQAVGAADAR
jgi:hypothetical protein